MASGTRAKLREELEGIHKNTEWIKSHVVQCMAKIPKEGYDQLNQGLALLSQMNAELDKLAQSLYQSI